MPNTRGDVRRRTRVVGSGALGWRGLLACEPTLHSEAPARPAYTAVVLTVLLGSRSPDAVVLQVVRVEAQLRPEEPAVAVGDRAQDDIVAPVPGVLVERSGKLAGPISRSAGAMPQNEQAYVHRLPEFVQHGDAQRSSGESEILAEEEHQRACHDSPAKHSPPGNPPPGCLPQVPHVSGQ